jgi:hypothetical protein
MCFTYSAGHVGHSIWLETRDELFLHSPGPGKSVPSLGFLVTVFKTVSKSVSIQEAKAQGACKPIGVLDIVGVIECHLSWN